MSTDSPSFFTDDGDVRATADGYGYNDDEDDVYSSYPDDDDAIDDRVATSDDIDPRKLVKDPTPSEIRWYYRNTPFAPIVVNKPIDDAFKHGYDIGNDPTEEAEDFLDDWEPHRQDARKAARKDGVSFVHYIFEDDASGSEPPERATDVVGFNTFTIDELDDGLQPREIAPHTEYSHEQLRVLDQGIVIVEDISSVDNHDIVGVIYDVPSSDATRQDGNDGDQYRFVHASRLQHFVENEEVDGPMDENWVGEVTGHPKLGHIIHELKALAKTSWALGQTLFRYSAPLHVVEMDSDVQGSLGNGDIEDHLEKLNEQTRKVNSASNINLPPGHEMKSVSASSDIDPEPFIVALVEMLCAGSEFTKTVLMGTQSGTVSGSESDIKNYFNQVQRYRHTTAERKMREALAIARNADGSVVSPMTVGFDVDWGPLFKMDRMDTAESMVSITTAVSNAVSNYVLTANEARDILLAEWADLGSDVDPEDFDDLTEGDFDDLDRVNAGIEGKFGAGEEDGETRENPRQRNGGGVEQGSTQSESNPASS